MVFLFIAVFTCTAVLDACAAVSGTSDVIVSLSRGRQLRGIQETYSTGEQLCTFYGIPYAQPPTGNLRFEPPLPANDWSGVKDAKTQGNICPQNPSEQSSHTRSEDCLNLSVYSPELNGSLPVFFWIHGGGFHEGSQFGDGDGAHIARRGVVAVMINYRLSPFGFLSTGDDIMPGNYGMLDQVLALKWVRENIQSFGGDPDRVTIAGASAGAHSVDYHILSPLSRGLFRRAIMESGSSLCSSALEWPGKLIKVKDFTQTVAASVGCTGNNSSDLLRCLKTADAALLLNASVNAEKTLGITFIAVPRVETTFSFLPDYPTNIISSGQFNKVDTLRGFNSGEWSFAVHDTANDGVTRHQFTQYFAAYFRKSSFVNDAAINRLVENAYLSDLTDRFAIRANVINALADMTYGAASLYDLVRTIDKTGTGNHHYFYQFSYRGNNTSTPEWKGVPHSGERPYVFSDPAATSLTDGDKLISDQVQSMWVNFVKFGDPTPVQGTNGAASSQATNGALRWGEFTNGSHVMLQIDFHPHMQTFPRSFVVDLYQKVVDLMLATSLVNLNDVVIG